MDSNNSRSGCKIAWDARFESDGRDRRRRRRARIALPVHIRGGMGSLEFFKTKRRQLTFR
jgi:hypothetical protein